jgi:hypothetical protein
MKRRPAPLPDPAAPRILKLVLVIAVFFVMPAALFFRLSGTEGSTRVAVQIVAMTLPATGALILRLNPDLVPDRDAFRGLSPLAWASLAALSAAVVACAWWLAGAIGGAAASK